MSRTYRRNSKEHIRRHVGSLDDCRKDPWWVKRHYPDLTVEQAYARMVAKFIGDNPPGRYGEPRWWRRTHGNKKLRCREKLALFIHHRDDSWDLHSPDSRCRNAAYFWW